MPIKIALAGNPNSGKTTLFNALTGSNQFVGNWPGVTVEKKEGKLRGNRDVIITDLPGIYSLSPYSPEEIVARNYLIDEQPDVILNIIDGTNLERNLFLTTQLTELGIPLVACINMIDIVKKNGDQINTENLAELLGCKVVCISAIKNTGVDEAAAAAVLAANGAKTKPQHSFSGTVEHILAHIEEAVLHSLPDHQQRWYAIKLFERDEKIIAKLGLTDKQLTHIENDIKNCETELDDDSESIITSERYKYIDSIIKDCLKIKNRGKLSVSDKIDKIVTSRVFGLPIFAVIMFLVYFISVTTVGTIATDWANDGVFGDGWLLLGIGSAKYEEAADEYAYYDTIVSSYEEAAEAEGITIEENTDFTAAADFYDENGNIDESINVTYSDYKNAIEAEEPDPSEYGVWIPGIPVILGGWLDDIGTADWLTGLIMDGIVAGVGAVLGFVPQMLILFLLLAFLEACGYMARIAFVMDRIFRKFGLSGKSFIPMLVGTGCGVPGIMASRTIENDRDRKMTIMTTTFIPCGAKLPIIALIAGAMFKGAWWVAPSAYFFGIAAIVISGIILKKTKAFAGDAAPFVMELPAYHMPTLFNLLRSMWERGWSFIKKAGTIILLATVFIWFASNFGWKDGSFGIVEMNSSILAVIGSAIAWIFTPLGWGNWQGAVATITGLIAKENVVGTFGVLFGGFEEVAENGWQIWNNMKEVFSPLSAYSFLIFNLLCAPCFAAMGAIKREMNNWKWTAFAITYQCVFAYIISLIVFNIGSMITGNINIIGLITAFILLAFIVFMILRPENNRLKIKQ